MPRPMTPAETKLQTIKIILMAIGVSWMIFLGIKIAILLEVIVRQLSPI